MGAGLGAAANPLMQALDTDGDGVLSKKEIGAAAKSLRKLDANRDGKLTPDELAPGWCRRPGWGRAAIGGLDSAVQRAGGRGSRRVAVPADVAVTARASAAVPVAQAVASVVRAVLAVSRARRATDFLRKPAS